MTQQIVLVTDALPADALEVLEKESGLDLVQRVGEDFTDVAEKASAWIVRSGTKITKEWIDKAPALRCIVRAGSGVDNIDVEAARARDIVVMNTPGANARAAAELTVALMISIARQIPQAHASLAEGKWERKKFVGTELRGKTLGVIGSGRVGREVIRMGDGLGMKVVASDPNPDSLKDVPCEQASFDEVVRQADYLTIHAPLTPETRNSIDAGVLGMCRKGAVIINVGRGGLIDEKALFDALESGHIGGAALDVFESEPPEGSPLIGHERVIATPHIGASTKEAQIAVGVMAAQQVRDYLIDGKSIHTV